MGVQNKPAGSRSPIYHMGFPTQAGFVVNASG